jgi:hypothetical protein
MGGGPELEGATALEFLKCKIPVIPVYHYVEPYILVAPAEVWAAAPSSCSIHERS